jgi:hypothetical protein
MVLRAPLLEAFAMDQGPFKSHTASHQQYCIARPIKTSGNQLEFKPFSNRLSPLPLTVPQQPGKTKRP